MEPKRRDDKGRVLLMGEWQDADGRYRYKYTDALGKRRILYSWRLTDTDAVPLITGPSGPETIILPQFHPSPARIGSG